MEKYDFSGWATRNDLKCSDGRTIMKDAFKHCDGQTVPLVWNHQHNEPNNILGHALLENRNEGVYAYCSFNDTQTAQNAKNFVQHGDICALSIYANKLKQQGGNVIHGQIREVSLVLAGANPGAYIDSIISHGDESEEEAIIFTGEDLMLFHAEDDIPEETFAPAVEDFKEEQPMSFDVMYHADKPKTVADVFNTMTKEQQDAVFALVGAAMDNDDSEEDSKMKHNVFENEDFESDGVLSHSDQTKILDMAKSKSCGHLQGALKAYAEENGYLAHGFDDEDLEMLFPEYKNLGPAAPEFITRDQGWIGSVMKGVHKSPISRIRTRQMDLRQDGLRGLGYKKGDEKVLTGNPKLLNRTTDPQTVYVKDSMHRDDIIDITDFDVVNYQYRIMRMSLDEELATAIMIGDGREEGDANKIYQEHIRAIWHDDDLYSIHYDVDIEAARAALQGTDTNAHFGENYIYAEAIITAALYSREQYKGSGALEFYCTPHLLNVMLLARDLNGRRIYDSKSDLAAALNVTAIHTVEQFEDKTRTTKDGDVKKLLGIFVNLNDYQVGSTKGGEITKFDDFDIDFNQYKYLIETRLSGALTRVYSAICLEEPVEAIAG